MKKSRLTLLSFIVILILACNLPAGTPTAPATDTPQPTAAEAADVATDSPAPVIVASATAIAPPVPSAPVASPDGQPVNCRSGPALSWDIVLLLPVGKVVEIAAKTSDGTWFEVRNPTASGGFCWVSSSVVTTNGDLSGVQVVAAPPTPIPPTSVAGIISDLSVTVSPTSISVGGCMGPVQPSTARATITVSGPIKIQWHFETQQNGKLQKYIQNFPKAGTKYVSETFTPKLTAGTYWVKLVIDGIGLDDADAVAKYTIHC